MEAKKHPALLVSLVALGLIAATGVALTAVEAFKYTSSQNALAVAEKEAERLLNREPVALTQENLLAAQKTLESFRAAEADHRAELAGGAGSRFDTEFKGEPGELGSEIKEFVERWHGKLKAEGIPIIALRPADLAFGFSRYYQTGVNPQKALPGVYRQTKIIEFLLKTLVDSKLKDDLRLLGVERQPIELVGINSVSFNKDEVQAVHDAVLKQEGLLRAETFRIKFIARTEVIRRFINAVTDAHRPICVRGVEISVPTKEQMVLPAVEAAKTQTDIALPAGFFAEPAPDAAKPADAAATPVVVKPEIIVEAAPSVVTVTFAYIDAVKTESPAPPPANP